jgi:hypothetical protein
MMRLFCALVVSSAVPVTMAELEHDHSGHDHTYVGRNADAQWGTADDSQLWIFAIPDQPIWDTIHMEPTGDWIGGKQIYEAELDCWHSAHPESGLSQLGERIRPSYPTGVSASNAYHVQYGFVLDER